MISFKWYVTVISMAALLVGCLSAEKRKKLDRNSVEMAQEKDIKSLGIGEIKKQSNDEAAGWSENDNIGLKIPDSHENHALGEIPPQKTRDEHGAATINFPLLARAFSSPSFDFLLPLNNSNDHLVFGQIGARHYDGRNIINFGVGQRHFFKHWMLGYNSFYDAQISSNHHQRLGIGLELWSKNVKFSTNSYYRLSGWKTSYLLKGKEERAANGYDLNLDAYLPHYPQIGGRVKYEHYFGKDVATLNRHERDKNPSALTLGLTYNPVPLVTVGLDRSQWSSGKSEAKGNIMFNYRLNVPLSKQLDPHMTPISKNFTGGRFNPVDRNNNIILEYKSEETIAFQLPPELKGIEHERRNIPVDIKTQFGIGRIDWDDSSLIPRGGRIITLPNNIYQVQLPAFDAHGTNQFIISAVAYDRQGHTSNRSTMTIHTELAQPVQAEASITEEIVLPLHTQTEIVENTDPDLISELSIETESESEYQEENPILSEGSSYEISSLSSTEDGIEFILNSPPSPVLPPPLPAISKMTNIESIRKQVASEVSSPNTQSAGNSKSEFINQIKNYNRNSLKPVYSKYKITENQSDNTANETVKKHGTKLEQIPSLSPSAPVIADNDSDKNPSKKVVPPNISLPILSRNSLNNMPTDLHSEIMNFDRSSLKSVSSKYSDSENHSNKSGYEGITSSSPASSEKSLFQILELMRPAIKISSDEESNTDSDKEEWNDIP